MEWKRKVVLAKKMFVDGTVTEIEVDGSLGKFMLELKNEGDRVERKETRRHVLLSAVDPEDRYVYQK